MNKAFEDILERLETADSVKVFGSLNSGNRLIPVQDAKQIVQEVAEEYNGGWIACSEMLPEENQEVMLQDFYGNITIEKMKTNDGLEGFSDGDWWSSANNYVAWHPLPELYKESD